MRSGFRKRSATSPSRTLALCGCLCLVAGGVPAAVAQSGGQVLSDAESVRGWQPAVRLTAPGDAKVGQYAVTWTTPAAGSTATLAFPLDARQRAAVARARTLSFWYRADGPARPETLHVKIIAAPLADGWQALYPLPVGAPGEWKRAEISVQEFEDEWGEAPEKNSGAIHLRIGKKDGDAVRVSVDDVRFTPLPAGVAVNAGKRSQKESVKVTPLVTEARAARMAAAAHPRLLLTPGEAAAARRRATQTPWGRAYLEGLRKRGDEAVATPIALPERGGQWYHWYACPKHGTRLQTEGPTRHVCPTDGEVYSGYPYDDVYLSKVHDAYSASMRDLGLLYRLTGEKKYGAKAREILLAYAAKYPSYPLHDINGKERVGGGKVGPQTLDESTWIIPVAQACDMVWDLLSPADVETLKTRLFYPATEVIRQHKMGVHNIQCWKNSAVGTVGLLFGDAALVREAIDDPARGMQTQIREGITDDGPWYEGAWGYHFYTMSALAPLAEAAHRAGIPVYEGEMGERYRRFYAAPLDFAMPNGRLPAFNDSTSASANGNTLYEIAYARWKDPALAAPLTAGSGGGNRANVNAVVAGADSLPVARAKAEPGRNFENSGYAILRAGEGADAAWLCLKYGPHGGGHGHPDKLSFVYYAGGRPLAHDPGITTYGVPVHLGWYKTTLAHNTLTVDEESQRAATGKCLEFRTGADWSGALTDAGTAIPGVTFRRAAFLLPNGAAAFLDLVRVQDGQPRTLDLAVHTPGARPAPPAGVGEPYTPPQKPGYSYLRDVRALKDAGLLRLAAGPDRNAAANVLFAAPTAAAAEATTTYLLGTGVGSNTEDRVPVVIARRRAAGTAYAWALSQPGTPPDSMEAVAVTAASDGSPVPAHEATAARLKVAGTTYLLVANPAGKAIKAGGWSGSDKLACVAQQQ
ncbi:MAG TPA: heparinase II/III family protein [Armatimonadaceae bacterium]|nr:heparinase II/III family protein [Armatimonadaceae bacterium]